MWESKADPSIKPFFLRCMCDGETGSVAVHFGTEPYGEPIANWMRDFRIVG